LESNRIAGIFRCNWMTCAPFASAASICAALLHHRSTLGQVFGAVVGTPEIVALAVGEL
jgi:hypothetical protein